MAKFWIFLLLAFVGLLLAVNYVSRRSSQVQIDNAGRTALITNDAPETRAALTPANDPPAPNASAAPAAGTLYKCVDGAGHQSFQSQPCDAGSTQAWVRDATPEPEPSRDERLRRARMQQQLDRSVASPPTRQAYATGSTSASADPAKSSACRVARAADAAYRRQPLRYITHDGLRQHGDRVNEACY